MRCQGIGSGLLGVAALTQATGPHVTSTTTRKCIMHLHSSTLVCVRAGLRGLMYVRSSALSCTSSLANCLEKYIHVCTHLRWTRCKTKPPSCTLSVRPQAARSTTSAHSLPQEAATFAPKPEPKSPTQRSTRAILAARPAARSRRNGYDSIPSSLLSQAALLAPRI